VDQGVQPSASPILQYKGDCLLVKVPLAVERTIRRRRWLHVLRFLAVRELRRRRKRKENRQIVTEVMGIDGGCDQHAEVDNGGRPEAKPTTASRGS